MKTYEATEKDFNKKTYIVDAAGKTLGRLATRVASVIIGKEKVFFCKDKIVGDQVIVINAEKILVTGKKNKTKIYTHYTGYPSGLRTYTFEDLMTKKPEEIILRAVWRMLPKNRIGQKMRTRVMVFAGAQHNQKSLKPIPMEV
ncbi:MAG: 50S ribosomal protein L13 [Omnitrophica bacterium GWA2_52_8]|nr:MAG: 50S ribosomal protein L13 [Omnitrophica bacterium GWA2_52_8]